MIGFTLKCTCEQPWGKDADIAFNANSSEKCNECDSTILSRMGQSAIKFHQEVISPADGPRSNFIPSSSQYTKEAMCKYGFFTGYMMGCDRLMRENDDEWVYKKTADPKGRPIKWDPVR